MLSTDTIGAAYAAGEETRLGRIEPGYQADLTVLDVDVSADPALLAAAKVEQVWVAGIPRYEAGTGVLPPAPAIFFAEVSGAGPILPAVLVADLP